MAIRLLTGSSLVLAGLLLGCGKPVPALVEPSLVEPPPHELASWPWSHEVLEDVARGAHLNRTTGADGTACELFEFDLGVNPRFSLVLYDQDQDDEKPFDNAASITRTVDRVVRDWPGGRKFVGEGRPQDPPPTSPLPRHRTGARGRLAPVLAWNGPFFAYERSGPEVLGRHIGPVVLGGKVRYKVGSHRWTLGWEEGALAGSLTKSGAGSPHSMELLHRPKKAELAKFEFAVSGVQALIKEGKALRLEPFPKFASQIKQSPVPSTPEEAGHIPMVDHMRTSRTSLAWSRDFKKLYVLLVRESDHELGSKLGLKRGEAQQAGWTLADLQRFWLSLGAWGAINSDGGDVMQRWVRLPSGAEYLPPKNGQGTLMSFLVIER